MENKKSSAELRVAGGADKSEVEGTSENTNQRFDIGPNGLSREILTSGAGHTQINILNGDTADEAEVVLTWVEKGGSAKYQVVTINKRGHSQWVRGVFNGARLNITNQSLKATTTITVSADS